jgi:hypothetical protein
VPISIGRQIRTQGERRFCDLLSFSPEIQHPKTGRLFPAGGENYIR